MGWAAKQCSQLILGLGEGGCPPRLRLPRPLPAAVSDYTEQTELINGVERLQSPRLGYPHYTHV